MLKAETNEASFIDAVMKGLEENLPAIFTRREIPKLLGGSVSAGTLANLGKNGPPYFIINKHATYEKRTFLDWLRKQIQLKNFCSQV